MNFLVCLQVRRLDDPAPLRDFRLDISAELRWSAAQRFRAFMHEPFSDIGQREHYHGRGIGPGNYFARRARRKHQAVPCSGLEFWIA